MTNRENNQPQWIPNGRVKKAASPPAIPTSGLDRVEKLHAIDVIARAVQQPDDTLREAKSKVRKMMNTAIENGELIVHSDRTLTFGTIVVWARSKSRWSTLPLLAGMPMVPIDAEIRASGTAKSWMTAEVIPGNLAACQAALAAAQDHIVQLAHQIAALTAELAAIRALADKQKRRVAVNRASAKLPRTPK